jgi:flagellar hook-associated protein 2
MAGNVSADTYSAGAVRIIGQDAKIYLNGADFTSSSNTFTINGLTITAQATTTTEDKIGTPEGEEDAITITTSTDSQGIYDQIKDFLSSYNTLINNMTSYYNADSSTSDYEPLTDDEKEAMTDSQIEKWEEKGKSGVLRRDTTLSSLMSAMTSAMSQSYTVNGKSYSLSSFGIKTISILNAAENEQNAYHIDGDEDDDSTKANTDKLMAAIISDPDGVTSFFQQLTNQLYTNLGTKMSSTSLRTYGTFYNDKEMATEYSDYTTTISNWETKLSDLEDSYYKKFAAMESALAKLQSNSSSLSSLLG